MKRALFPLLILCTAYYFTNPYWYGDALWYAWDVARPGPVVLDSFHLFWRPAARLLWEWLVTASPNIDPLIALRLFASLGTALLVLGVYRLSTRLGLSIGSSFNAAFLVGGSHFALAYGGSGASYTASVALTVWSLAVLFPSKDEESTSKHGILSAILFFLGWSAWGVNVLLFPALFISAAYSASGTLGRRVFRGALVCATSAILIAGTLAITYYKFVQIGGVPTFIDWWSEAKSHGVTSSFSVMSIARAILGFFIGFVYLGNFGTSIKQFMLGEIPASELASYALPLLALSIFLLVLTKALLRTLLVFGRSRGELKNVFPIVLSGVALVPVALFAVGWNGSDVERFCLALPFVSIAIIFALGDGGLAIFLPCFLLSVNLGTLTIPTLKDKGGIVTLLGKTAEEHVSKGSLIILTGQNLGPTVWVPAMYFNGMRVYSVSFDVLMRGADGWRDRLSAAIKLSNDEHHSVVVLSDLLGEPTPGGIGLSEKEYPTPSMDELKQYFEAWPRGDRWKVDKYEFVEVVVP